MKFHSVPHEIEAFQFTGMDIKPPEWFKKAHENDQAQITNSEKHGTYINIYAKKDGKIIQTEKAFLNDWICFMKYDYGSGLDGKIYVLTDQKFKSSYTPHKEP